MRLLKLTGGHTMQCFICFDMERRGYVSEAKYWKDKKLKAIKYRLVVPVDKYNEFLSSEE